MKLSSRVFFDESLTSPMYSVPGRFLAPPGMVGAKFSIVLSDVAYRDSSTRPSMSGDHSPLKLDCKNSGIVSSAFGVVFFRSLEEVRVFS